MASHDLELDTETSSSPRILPSFHLPRPFPSNTPGSAIDLTELHGTPPAAFAKLGSSSRDHSPHRPERVVVGLKGEGRVGPGMGILGEWDVGAAVQGLNGNGNGNGAGFGGDEAAIGLGDLAVLMRTIDFAAQKHSCQRRKDVDQTPYINHPIAVANFLTSTGITDVRVIQAAVLHDTVEDTHTTLEEIEEVFGAEVARIVAECTDDTTLTGQQRKLEQVRLAPHKSREAQMVKLADKLHNLESIRRSPPVGWGVRRIQAYFIWAKQVTDICAPSHPRLAARLQRLYETAYTRVNGKYHPCHPGVCGPLTEEEKRHIDSRLSLLKDGETPCPKPIFF